ncbi:jg44 [Pararge aegeria aegeria]|uniref:Jg44 protein n=1 Tax=Pararge aegeria aegeria TaxID=348720 RepID=A0A8S4QWK8_9NEOP|nr:jg44 [Pararge aegeria aegeria]
MALFGGSNAVCNYRRVTWWDRWVRGVESGEEVAAARSNLRYDAAISGTAATWYVLGGAYARRSARSSLPMCIGKRPSASGEEAFGSPVVMWSSWGAP